MAETPIPGVSAREPLVRMPAEPGRAMLAAVLMVLITDAFVIGAGFAMRALSTQPSAVRGAVFGTIAIIGYVSGLITAVALTRTRGVPGTFVDDYGFRGLTATGFWLALSGAIVARLAGGLWSALMLALKVKLPGMEIDPSALLPKDPVSIAFAFVLFAGVAPFVEEVGFRGILYGSLQRRMPALAANAISAALFAGLHFNLFAFVPIFIASLIFGWLFRRTQSLWTPIFAHATFNGIGLAIAYLVQIKPGV